MMKLLIIVWNMLMLIDKLEERDTFKKGRDKYTILAFKEDYIHTVDSEDRFHPFPYGIQVRKAKFVPKKRRKR